MIKRILAIIIPLLTCAALVAQEKGNVKKPIIKIIAKSVIA